MCGQRTYSTPVVLRDETAENYEHRQVETVALAVTVVLRGTRRPIQIHSSTYNGNGSTKSNAVCRKIQSITNERPGGNELNIYIYDVF